MCSTAVAQDSLVNGDFQLLCPKACNAQGHYHPDETCSADVYDILGA